MKQFYKNILYSLLFFLIAFLAVEGFLRVGYSALMAFRTFIGSDFYKVTLMRGTTIINDAYDEQRFKTTDFPIMEYNSYLGYIPKKNFSGNGYHTNQYHLRYEENFPQGKATNEIRIFITGGSTAWGAGISQDIVYFTVLEDLLNQKYTKFKIRVLSGGVGAYASTQERIFFENIVLPLKPDIFMMFSGYNDTYYGYRGTDIIKEADYLRIKNHLKGRIDQILVDEYDANNPTDPPRYKEYKSKISYLVDRIIYKGKFPNKAILQEYLEKKTMRKPANVYNNLMHNVHIIKQLCNSAYSKFVFYLQPSLHNTKKNFSKWEKHTFKIHSEFFVGFSSYNQKIYSTYRELIPIDAKNNNYLFIDGDKAISFEEKTAFSDDVHFGYRGNQLIGEHMFNILIPLIDKIIQKKRAGGGLNKT
jgi:lysophospholipase L1-like esterase